MNKQCSVWFQHSSYETDEFGELSKEQAIAKFAEVDLEKECQEMTQAIDSNDDWCQFGMGFNSSGGSRAHMYIEDEASKSFTLRVERPSKKKLFGFIPISSSQTKHIEGIKLNGIAFYIEKIYSNFDGLFD